MIQLFSREVSITKIATVHENLRIKFLVFSLLRAITTRNLPYASARKTASRWQFERRTNATARCGIEPSPLPAKLRGRFTAWPTHASTLPQSSWPKGSKGEHGRAHPLVGQAQIVPSTLLGTTTHAPAHMPFAPF